MKGRGEDGGGEGKQSRAEPCLTPKKGTREGEDKERRETERQRKNPSELPRERDKNRENEKQESYKSQKTTWTFKEGDCSPFKSLFLHYYGSELINRITSCLS